MFLQVGRCNISVSVGNGTLSCFFAFLALRHNVQSLSAAEKASRDYRAQLYRNLQLACLEMYYFSGTSMDLRIALRGLLRFISHQRRTKKSR